MARVTVEDCLAKLPNRFRLIRLATKRARQLAVGGDEARVMWDHDKPTVVALREIADGYVTEEMFENMEEPVEHQETATDLDADLTLAFAALANQYSAAIPDDSADRE